MTRGEEGETDGLKHGVTESGSEGESTHNTVLSRVWLSYLRDKEFTIKPFGYETSQIVGLR